MNNLYTQKHDISVGHIKEGKLIFEKQIGSAFYINNSEKSFYKIKLWSLKGNEYYLTKNLANENYTIFAKIKDEDSRGPIFQEPIGFGSFDERAKDFLQLQINFPWQKFYLSLHPNNNA